MTWNYIPRKQRLFTVKIIVGKKDILIKFDFLGYSFQPRTAKSKRNGKLFLGFGCAISTKSKKKIIEVFRKSSFHKWTGSDITRIADEFNSKIRGCNNYYSKFSSHIFIDSFIKYHVNRFKFAHELSKNAGF